METTIKFQLDPEHVALLNEMRNELRTLSEQVSCLKMANSEQEKGTNEFIDTEEASRMIGVKRATMYQDRYQEIPHFKVGKKILYKRSVIDNYVLNGRKTTETEIKEQAIDYINKKEIKKIIK